MVVQLPSEPEVEAQPAEIEAGVIDAARARHRRERWGAAVVAAIAVGVALLFGLGGGGGGAASPGEHQGGRPPVAGSHASSQTPGLVTHVGSVLESGLMAPGVGWVSTDRNLYLTRDGGLRWELLSQAQSSPARRALAIHQSAPGRSMADNLGSSSAPSSQVLALTFLGRAHVAASCRDQGRAPDGMLTVTADAGRSWATHLLPGCQLEQSLSFVNAHVGYAVSSLSSRDSTLYRTNDGGAQWRPVSRFPAPMTVSFGSRTDGFAFVTPNTAQAAAVLYRTTDAGRTWKRLRICGDTPDPTFTIYCDAPVSFGRNGVVLAVAQDLSKVHSDHTYLYTTADAGAHWTRHAVPPLDSPEMPVFSAPNATDIFVYAINGVLHTSTDGGRSWHSMPEPQFRTVEQMQFVNADYGWLVTPTAFDYTRDGGRIWKPVGTR
jgi:photosystem II stability/assembly factor-like uncharacterized protein